MLRVRSSSQPLGAATARAPGEPSETVSAPLFQSLLEKLGEDRRRILLDLGPMQPQLLTLLNGCRCRLENADLAAGLESLNGVDEPEELARRVDALLPKNGETFDVVFCWEFLNYLERDALIALMAAIATRCSPGAMVHALINYTDQWMPAQPGHLVPADSGHLRNRANGTREREAPRYTIEALRSCLPGYSLDRARLLGNGMQEYLLKL